MVQELVVGIDIVMYTERERERERENALTGSFEMNLTSAEAQKSLVF